VWQEFDPEGVRSVLQALAYRTKETIFLPLVHLKEACAFADYLGESAASLHLVLDCDPETANGIDDMGTHWKTVDDWFMGDTEHHAWIQER
jgi:hypothetical protein